MLSSSPKCVLVVDDDETIRQAIGDILEMVGYHVEMATDGRDALGKVRTSRPDAIVLDLMMPVMDGFEFLSILRENSQLASIPVVVVTAKDLTAEDRERLTGCVNQIILKGATDRKKLLAEINAILAKKAPNT